jgi:hypothetical protein
MMLRFFAHSHQHKGLPYIKALERDGFQRVRFYADLYLLDHDCGQRPYVAEAAKLGKPILLYPHAARPPVLPFREVANARTITFAPIHPNGNGWLPPLYWERNRLVFEELLKLNGIRITVRHLHSLEANGLWKVDRKNVRFVLGERDGRTTEIDTSDLVVAAQTYAFIAIARGVPTVMIDEDICPCSGSEPETLREVANWERYRAIWKYPWNFPEQGLAELLQAAGRYDPVEWKRRFIGDPFRAAAFAGLVKGIVQTHAMAVRS